MIGDTKKTGRGFLGSVSAGRRYLQTETEPMSTAREAVLWLHMYWWAKKNNARGKIICAR